MNELTYNELIYLTSKLFNQFIDVVLFSDTNILMPLTVRNVEKYLYR